MENFINNRVDYEFNLLRFTSAWAHKKEGSVETLLEHAERSLNTTDYLLSHLNINNNLEPISINLRNILLKGIRFASFFHDYGKQNKNFQIEKMGNHEYNDQQFNELEFNTLELDSEKIYNGTDHSRFNNIDLVINFLSEEIEELEIQNKRKKKKIEKDIIKFFKLLVEKHHGGFESTQNLGFHSELFKVPDISFILEIFHSILISSDVFATKYYMENNTSKITIEEYLQRMLDYDINISEKFSSIESKLIYNKELYQDDSILEITDINKLKREFARNTKNGDHAGNISFLNGKVGVGKTNLSFIAANETFKHYDDLKKFIYVSPLNSLLYQVSSEMTEATDIAREDIKIINGIERKKEKLSSSNLEDSYSYENFMNQIMMTSSVNFFQKLFNKRKKDISPLIFLSNAYIVIDEIQLNNDYLFNLVFIYLNNLSKYLNCKILIISATIPVPKYVKENILEDNVQYIFNKEIMDTLNSNEFLNRNTYNFDYFDSEFDNKALAYLMGKDSRSILVVHNSIRRLQEYFNIVKSGIPDDYEILFYNNNIIQPQLNTVIKKIKNGEKVIVFATRKIETGVDISFQDGIKFADSLDNVEQFGGRINRYGNHFNSEILLIQDSAVFASSQHRDIVLKRYAESKNTFEEYLPSIERFYELIFNSNGSGEFVQYYKNNNLKSLNEIEIIQTYHKFNFIVEIDFIEYRDIFEEDFLNSIDKFGINNSLELFRKFKFQKELIPYKDYFKISGHINKRTNFYKELNRLNSINISLSKKHIDPYFVLSSENFFYDIKLGIEFDKDEDILELEELMYG